MKNYDNEIINGLATELAKRDYKELFETISEMSFEDAFKKLNGFNLQVSVTTIGKSKTLMSADMMFDVNYKSICTTIYQTRHNKCELAESVDVWLDEFSSPIISQMDICIEDCN